MSRVSERNLSPRNGHILIAGGPCRISGCANQKEASLDDQEDNAREAIAELYDGPVDFRVIATIGKGERLDRPELELIEAAYKSGEYDVFVYDDLSRLIRGGEAVRLLGIGVDKGTRSICINDGIDTVDETWEEDALSACSENVAHNQRTSMRVKQKTMNRFKKFGAKTKYRIHGYVVPDGVKTLDGWVKDSDAEQHIHEGARILRSTLNGQAVADYFRKNQVPVGPYARNKEWNGTMVLRYYRNPLLKGMPLRGRMATAKHHGSGKRPSRRNLKGPTYYNAPHLAFFEPDEFDDLVALLAESNKNYRRKNVNGVDPRINVPRKRTRFPGQHGRCWYCGFHHVWGGNGVTANLMCSNARHWRCWNSIGYDGELAVKRVTDVIRGELLRLPGFDDQYRELIERVGANENSDVSRRWDRLKSDEVELAKTRERFVDAIEKFGVQQMFDAKLKEIDASELKLRIERRTLERIGQERLTLPESTTVLRQMLEEELACAAHDSPEFGDVLRKLCPDFMVYAVRSCDRGNFLPRARVRLALDGIIPDAALVPGIDGLLRREVTFDLFELPQRERIRSDAVKWKATGLGPKAIAAKIAETTNERPTATAVQHALALHNRVLDLGLTSPYIQVVEPPEDHPKLRRHKNPKYRFVPLEGYVPPTL